MKKSEVFNGSDITSAVFLCEECEAEVDYDMLGKHMRAHEAEVIE